MSKFTVKIKKIDFENSNNITYIKISELTFCVVVGQRQQLETQ